jgi:hypothetical protein
VIICRPPPPGADAEQGCQAYYSLDDKIPVIRADGLRRITEDRRLPAPTCARVPDNQNVIRISSSPPPSEVQPVLHSSDDSSAVVASSPQPSTQVPKKRKARVDSSLPSDDDVYVADPKPKRSKAGQKTVVAAGQRKRDVGVKGKGKEVVGNGKGKEKEEKRARAKPVKKTIKSVAFIDDEDDSSSDNKPPPATRPTPKPAYHGAKSLQASLPESEREVRKDSVLTPADNHAAQPPTVHAAQPHVASNPISIPPAIPTDSSHDGHAKPSIGHMAQTTTVAAAPTGEASHPTPVTPAIPTHGAAPPGSEGQYPPHGPRPPLHGYPADDRYYPA